MVLEKTLESPLDCREIQLVHSERDQPWDFFGGNDAEAETPVLPLLAIVNITAVKLPTLGCLYLFDLVSYFFFFAYIPEGELSEQLPCATQDLIVHR